MPSKNDNETLVNRSIKDLLTRYLASTPQANRESLLRKSDFLQTQIYFKRNNPNVHTVRFNDDDDKEDEDFKKWVQAEYRCMVQILPRPLVEDPVPVAKEEKKPVVDPPSPIPHEDDKVVPPPPPEKKNGNEQVSSVQTSKAYLYAEVGDAKYRFNRDIAFNDLIQKIKQRSGIPDEQNIRIDHKDEASVLVTIANDQDLKDAVLHGQQAPTIVATIISRKRRDRSPSPVRVTKARSAAPDQEINQVLGTTISTIASVVSKVLWYIPS